MFQKGAFWGAFFVATFSGNLHRHVLRFFCERRDESSKNGACILR
jgi:hypothetical protein